MKIKARDYQEAIIAAVRFAFARGKKRPLVVSPTGSGKTVIFAIISEGASKKKKRVWILVHRTELLDQTSRTLRELGLPHGLIAADRAPDPLQMIQAAKVGTLVRRLETYTDAPDIIIVDEGHHATAGSWGKIIAAYPKALILGVTATPQRLDGRGLGDVYDDMILGPETRELIQRGFLSAPVYYAPPSLVDMTDAKVSGADFDAADIARRMDKPTITGDAVEHYSRICPGAPAVAFCASVKHAEHVAEAFRAAGYRSAVIDGNLPPGERRDRVRSLSDGRLHVLTSCDIISEGFDLPVVTSAILLRPTQSLSLHLQQVGRVLRPVYCKGMPLETDAERLAAIAKGGKPRAYILDHVGNCVRHGLAEDVRDWSLEGKKKRNKKNGDEPLIPVRQCPQCYCCHAPAPECPQCQHKYIVGAREYEVTEGSLSMLGGIVDEKHRQCKAPCLHVHSRWDHACPKCGASTGELPKKVVQARAETFEDLIRVGRERGYKSPYVWARRVWQSRQTKRDQIYA